MPFLIYLTLPTIEDLKSKTVRLSTLIAGGVMTGLSLLIRGFRYPDQWQSLLWQLVLAMLIAGGVKLLGRDQRLGRADGYFLAMMACFFEPGVFLAGCFWAFLMAAGYGVILVFIKKQTTFSYPFVPFIWLATLILLISYR